MEWSKKLTLDLIELLHVQECLWNMKHERYKDRQKKKDALAAIALQMNMNINDVDKKITNLKNQYNREIKKMKTKSGCGIDDVSPWYAFKPLGFLRNNILSKPARGAADTIFEGQSDNVESCFNSSVVEDHVYCTTPSVLEASDVSSITEKNEVKRGKFLDDTQKVPLFFKEAPNDNTMKQAAKEEFEVFGEYVAFELRGVTCKRNILELKKQIQDLIYLTKLNQMNNHESGSLRSHKKPPRKLYRAKQKQKPRLENFRIVLEN